MALRVRKGCVVPGRCVSLARVSLTGVRNGDAAALLRRLPGVLLQNDKQKRKVRHWIVRASGFLPHSLRALRVGVFPRLAGVVAGADSTLPQSAGGRSTTELLPGSQ